MASPAGRRGRRTTSTARSMPEARPDARRSRPPPVVRRKLSNGLEVLIAERHELPILTPEPGRQGGRDARPGRQGRARLADGRPAHRGDGHAATRSRLAGEPRPRSAPRSTPAATSRRCSLSTDDPDRSTRRRRWSCSPTCSSTRASRRRSWSGSAVQRLAALQAPGRQRRGDRRRRLPAAPLRRRAPLRPPDRWARRSRSRRSPATTSSPSTSGCSCPTTPR